jgi:signal transduction histidine kinase
MLRTVAMWARRTSGPAPRPTRRNLIVDALLAALLAAYALTVLHSDAQAAAQLVQLPKPFAKVAAGPGVRDYLSALFTTVPLAWRRRYPLAVFWLVIAATVIEPNHGDALTKLVACAIAAYTVAAYSPYRPAATISLVAAAAAVAGIYENAIPNIPKVFGAFLVIVPIAVAGITLRSLRMRIADAQQRERALEREKAQATQLATEQERSRIARELHDVITHNVSVMLVQAGAARKVMSRAPEQATAALLAVESAGRAAMTELQHAIGLLAPDGEAQLAPQPGLAELDQLIGRVRATGMRVDLAETGPARTLAPGSDLAAYRVVQEALTNAAKHAAGAPARVRLDYTRHDLIVEVGNDAGQRSPAAGDGNGRGLIGLRERLAVCGGRLQAGPLGDGGFQVRAVIPLHEVDVAEPV